MSQRVLGKLVLAATPIGNSADASQRLKELIASADVIAAEDTRKFKELAHRLAVTYTAKVISHHDHNERDRVDLLLDEVAAGKLVLVVSDAGMPTVSDPGYPLIAAAAQRDLPVTVAPGPSAVLTALALSGLATDRFAFEGFVPRKKSEKQRTFAAVSQDQRTLIYFESPHRIADTLEVMAQEFGSDRRIAVCRELTKTYEEVLRGSIESVQAKLSDQPRGEFVIVVAGAPTPVTPPMAELVSQVQEVVAQGERLKDATTQIAARYQVSRRDLYQAVIATR